MKNTELFYLIFKQTHMDRFLIGFLIYFTLSAVLILWLDDSITTIWDSIWFCFMIVTTIGFGDYTVTAPLARIAASFLGIYGIVLIAFVCGIGASYLFEKMKASNDESISKLVWQMAHIDALDDEKLSDLQKRIRLRHDGNAKHSGSSQTTYKDVLK